MEKVIVYPKTKLPLGKQPQKILQIWERARGIWKKKKTEPIRYLRKIRQEWEEKPR